MGVASPPVELTRVIAELGHRFDAQVVLRMRQLIGPLHSRAVDERTEILRDLRYGADGRQRLDVFRTRQAATLRPALVFVHGGGFVAGDKNSADGQPFYDNVGLWAIGQGLVGINLTYRLAPAHPWPCGAEDVAAAIAWLHRHGTEYGIDPDRIILMGQSAGAVHVASYVAHGAFHQVAGGGLRAAVLLSGLYDMQTAADNAPKTAYFGDNAGLWRERSSLQGLLETRLPLMIAVNEWDPKDFEQQALQLVAAHFERHGALPYFVQLKAQNHLSSILGLNLPGDPLGSELAAFIERVLT